MCIRDSAQSQSFEGGMTDARSAGTWLQMYIWLLVQSQGKVGLQDVTAHKHVRNLAFVDKVSATSDKKCLA